MDTPQNGRAEANAETEVFITKTEVARRLKKTVRTIENWQVRGIIPFIKAGRSVLFNWADVQAHLQRHFRVCRLDGLAPSPEIPERVTTIGKSQVAHGIHKQRQ